jgi:hypothetical protein
LFSFPGCPPPARPPDTLSAHPYFVSATPSDWPLNTNRPPAPVQLQIHPPAQLFGRGAGPRRCCYWPGLACSVWRRGPVRLDAPGRRPCRLLVRARPIRSARALAAGLENPVGDGDLVAGQVGLGAPPCPGRYGAVVAVERRFDVEGMVAPHGAACGYARHRPDPGDQVVARVVGEGGDSVGEGASARLQSARHRATPALREWFDHEASASPSVAKL